MSRTPAPRSVLLVELDGLGHRFYHVRTLARHALEENARVTVLTRVHEATREHLELHLSGLLDDITVIEVTERSWRMVELVAREVGADITVVPEADNWLLPLFRRLGWRGPGILSLLVMRARVPRLTALPRWMVAYTSKLLAVTALHLLPRVRFRVLRSQLWRGRSLWSGVHDPVALTCTPAGVAGLRQSWGLGTGRYWFGVLGAVSANKNLDLICRAMATLPGGQELGLLVAGRISPPVREQLPALLEVLEAHGVRTHVVDRLLDDVELDGAVSAIDCLVLAYELNAPSGTFGKALGAGTRVVAAGSPCLRRDAANVPQAALWSRLRLEDLAANLLAASTLGRPLPLRLPNEKDFAAALLD